MEVATSRTLRDHRRIVRDILLDAIRTCPTLKVTVDVPYVQKQAHMGYNAELDAALTGQALSEEAPLLGFTRIGHDSHGRARWSMQNPRFVWCGRHSRIASLVVVRVNGSVVFRAKHRWNGKSISCHIRSVPISLLATVLPDVGQTIRSQLVRICTTPKEPPTDGGVGGEDAD